jgi:hypothetical protein
MQANAGDLAALMSPKSCEIPIETREHKAPSQLHSSELFPNHFDD